MSHIYCLVLEDETTRYVGVTDDLKSRLEKHRKFKGDIHLLATMTVNDRLQAESLEAVLHEVQKTEHTIEDYFSQDLVRLHSLWYDGYSTPGPKDIRIKPKIRF